MGFAKRLPTTIFSPLFSYIPRITFTRNADIFDLVRRLKLRRFLGLPRGTHGL